MKTILSFLFLLLFFCSFGQEPSTIKVVVPNSDDEVYIAGDLASTGNWNPAQIKMDKTSDYERQISLNLTFPAEFKFTRGSWESEGIVKSLADNPNLRMDNKDSKNIFVIKAWSDKISTDQLYIDYELIQIDSKILQEPRSLKVYRPENYSADRKYPVLYISDAGTENFDVALNYVRSLCVNNSIPECILVGIIQKNRNQELDVFWNEDGVRFKDFLFQEAIPFINTNYSTSGFNAIIGHSDGAEYNHLLMMDTANPFRAFISISTNLNNDVRLELADYFGKYDGREMYSFIATGSYDSPDRTLAGNTINRLHQHSKNEKLKLELKNYSADHQNILSKCLLDGLLFVFQDYRNLANYADFKDYAENYQQDMEREYGILANFSENDVDFFFGKIVDNKDLAAYDYIIAFDEKHKILNSNYLDRANQYFYMGQYPESIEYWNKTIVDFTGIEDRVFYYNFYKAIDAYLIEKNPEGAIVFLEKSKKLIPQYSLEINYFIAKTSLTNQLEKKKGKAALRFCESNYRENKYFTEADLDALKTR